MSGVAALQLLLQLSFNVALMVTLISGQFLCTPHGKV